MKKILNFFFVNRLENESKWWHRLFKVILLSISLLVFVVYLFEGVSNSSNSWFSYYSKAFSLEDGYDSVRGIEKVCYGDWMAFPDTGSLSSSGGIKCNGVYLSDSDSKKYYQIYEDNLEVIRQTYNIDNLNKKYLDTSKCYTYDYECSAQILGKGIGLQNQDPSYIAFRDEVEKIPIKVKTKKEVNYDSVGLDIFNWIIVPFLAALLTLFSISIIYRVLMYIIFGNKEK